MKKGEEMTFEDVIRYYGNSYQFFKKTGKASANYRNWAERGYIPIETQLILEELTKGELRADLKDVPRRTFTKLSKRENET